MTKSRVLKKLRADEVVLTPCVGRVKEPWLTELIGRLGFDALWLDMEHRPFGYDVVDGISVACRATGMDLMVRILKTGYSTPMRILEFGANGIMVPHCCSVAEARQWVEWCRFPPLGKRGFDGAGVDADYMLADPSEYLKFGNEETFLVLQIEDREAVDCVEEMAAVEGVDLLFVGPADLSISYGAPFQFGHANFQKALDRVAAATAKAGKWWGIATPTPEAAQAAVDRGAKMITGGADHTVLVRGFQQNYSAFSKVTRKSSTPVVRPA